MDNFMKKKITPKNILKVVVIIVLVIAFELWYKVRPDAVMVIVCGIVILACTYGCVDTWYNTVGIKKDESIRMGAYYIGI